jgi:hypothetical protein
MPSRCCSTLSVRLRALPMACCAARSCTPASTAWRTISMKSGAKGNIVESP